MAPIITPPEKDYIGSDIYSKKKSTLVTVCCALERIFFIPSRISFHGKTFSGATNSSGFDLRALNSNVKRTFIVSCKLVKQTIH